MYYSFFYVSNFTNSMCSHSDLLSLKIFLPNPLSKMSRWGPALWHNGIGCPESYQFQSPLFLADKPGKKRRIWLKSLGLCTPWETPVNFLVAGFALAQPLPLWPFRQWNKGWKVSFSPNLSLQLCPLNKYNSSLKKKGLGKILQINSLRYFNLLSIYSQ